MEIYTAHYSYSGPDRLDITVKGQDPLGKFFAPTWKMVQDLKSGKMTEKEYRHEYNHLMFKSYGQNRRAWEEVLNRDRVVLVCFCASGEFCHRLIFAKILSSFGNKYMGEIK